MPKLSVLMPVYNAEKYIREAIDSIINQSFTDFEFIIIDDNSTDATLSILQDYKTKDDRLIIETNTTCSGVANALNRGLEIAQGEYLARMDADDVSDVQRFNIQVKFLDENSGVAIVGTWFNKINSQGKIYDRMQSFCNYDDIKSFCIAGSPFCQSSIMGRVKVFKEFGGYNCDYEKVQDYELWLRIMERYKIYNINQYLYNFRIHEDSVSAVFKEEILEKTAKANQASISSRRLDYKKAVQLFETWGTRCFYHNYGEIIKGKKVIVYGSGLGGRKFSNLEYRLNCPILCFLDGSSNKIGLELDGYKIYSPETVQELEYDYIVISSQYWQDIQDKLFSLGVNKERIIYSFIIEDEYIIKY